MLTLTLTKGPLCGVDSMSHSKPIRSDPTLRTMDVPDCTDTPSLQSLQIVIGQGPQFVAG